MNCNLAIRVSHEPYLGLVMPALRRSRTALPQLGCHPGLTWAWWCQRWGGLARHCPSWGGSAAASTCPCNNYTLYLYKYFIVALCGLYFNFLMRSKLLVLIVINIFHLSVWYYTLIWGYMILHKTKIYHHNVLFLFLQIILLTNFYLQLRYSNL